MCDCNNCTKSKENLEILLKIYNEYKWLIDAYVLDFYVDKHWDLLPNSWRRDFESISQSDLATVVDYTTILPNSKLICPLSILCLKNLFKHLNLARQSVCLNEIKISLNHEIVTHSETLMQCSSKMLNLEQDNCLIDHIKLKNSFWKFISPKKKHEIIMMSKICSQIAKQSDCRVVIDFGSGLGHLSRILAYGYGLKVCCLEADKTLSEHAQKLDHLFEVTAAKHLNEKEINELIHPVHLNTKIENTADLNVLVELIKTTLLLNEDFKFGVVGLHPCGDLTTVLLKFFKENNRNKFITVASCCYMKLTTQSENNYFRGYPLSEFLSNKTGNNLSYVSRELACHAVETYVEKLNKTTCLELKTHAFRATLEKIIVKYWPEKKHCGLKNSKCTEDLNFEEYCKKATKNMDFIIPEEAISSEEIKKCLREWKKVMTFYSLRLMFAPMIESIILIDRLLYIADKDTECSLIPAFDPKWSPRNHLIIATKNCK